MSVLFSALCMFSAVLYGARHTVRFQTQLLMERKEDKRKSNMREGRKEGGTGLEKEMNSPKTGLVILD